MAPNRRSTYLGGVIFFWLNKIGVVPIIEHPTANEEKIIRHGYQLQHQNKIILKSAAEDPITSQYPLPSPTHHHYHTTHTPHTTQHTHYIYTHSYTTYHTKTTPHTHTVEKKRPLLLIPDKQQGSLIQTLTRGSELPPNCGPLFFSPAYNSKILICKQ